MAEIDYITTMNLALCVTILILGYARYRTRNSKIPLYIGAAFGFFGISHMITLLGIQDMVSVQFIFRTLGYLTVLYTLMILEKEGREKINKKVLTAGHRH